MRRRGVHTLKHATTLLSLLLALLTLSLPLFVLNDVFKGNYVEIACSLFILGVVLFNIFALIRGDRLANLFALAVSCIGFGLLFVSL